MFKAAKIIPYKIARMNAVEEIRASPANSIDTKLCW